jgi:hypothetical protein
VDGAAAVVVAVSVVVGGDVAVVVGAETVLLESTVEVSAD